MALTYSAGTWTTTGNPTVTVTFKAGDEIVVVGGTESGGTDTLALPTASGLTFSLVTSTATAGECAAYLWRATAAAAGTSVVVTSVHTGTTDCGLQAWVRPNTATSTTTLTATITEAAFSTNPPAGSDVIVAYFDFLASAGASRTPTTASGTVTERVDAQVASHYTQWAADWQGVAAGTQSFGPTSYATPTVQVAQVGIVLGPSLPQRRPPIVPRARPQGALRRGFAYIGRSRSFGPVTPVFGAAGTYLTGAVTGTAQFPVPAGTAAGELVVIYMYLEATADIPPANVPAGFALEGRVSTGPNSGANDHDLLVYWKRCSTTDSGTYDFTLTSTFWREGVAVRYTNVIGAGNPFDIITSAATQSSTSGITPAVRAAAGYTNTLLTFAGTNFNQGAWSPTTGGLTERVDNGTNLTVEDLPQLAAGDTGSITATCTGGATTSIGWLAAIKGPNSVAVSTTSRPSPTITGQRARGRSALVRLLRNPAAPAGAPAASTPKPIVVTSRRRRAPGWSSTQRNGPLTPIPTPEPIVVPGRLIARARSKIIQLRSADHGPGPTIATPHPIVVSIRSARTRTRPAILIRPPAQPPAVVSTVATPKPVVVTSRVPRRIRPAIQLRSADRGPGSTIATPKPIVVTLGRIRRFRAAIVLRPPAQPPVVVSTIATPKPIVVTPRRVQRPRPSILARNPATATPIATPQPIVTARRPSRRSRAAVLLRSPLTPAAPAVAAARAAIVVGKRRLRPSSLARVLRGHPGALVPPYFPVRGPNRAEVVTRHSIRAVGRHDAVEYARRHSVFPIR